VSLDKWIFFMFPPASLGFSSFYVAIRWACKACPARPGNQHTVVCGQPTVFGGGQLHVFVGGGQVTVCWPQVG